MIIMWIYMNARYISPYMMLYDMSVTDIKEGEKALSNSPNHVRK
jgi:hypothetical protein